MAGKKDINSKLIYAAADGDTATIKDLLDNGANVEAKDYQADQTPLMFAALYGHTTTVEALLYNGADVNVKDNAGRSALVWAHYIRKPEIIELLKQHGATE